MSLVAYFEDIFISNSWSLHLTLSAISQNVYHSLYNATSPEEVPTQVQDTDEWLTSESAKQEKRQRHEKAVLVSADIDSRLDALRRPFTVLKNKKKPKPPLAPKKAQNSTSSESAEAAEEEEENKIRQEEDREKPTGQGMQWGSLCVFALPQRM